MSATFTGVLVGGLNDGEVVPEPKMSLRDLYISPPPKLQPVGPTSRAAEPVHYLRSEWHAEGGDSFIFYRHESMSYADAIAAVLTRYATKGRS